MFPKIDSLEIQDYLFDRNQAESGHLFTKASVQVVSESKGAVQNEVMVNTMRIESNEIKSQVEEIKLGEVIPAVEAVDWSVGNRNCDIRPRLVDKSSGKAFWTVGLRSQLLPRVLKTK